jgi:hypothetical protein
MTIRLMVRGYLGKVLQFELPWEIDEHNLDTVLPALAKQHAHAMSAGLLGMIEIEFLDEPNPHERFFRIGTDPSGMVMPMEFKL